MCIENRYPWNERHRTSPKIIRWILVNKLNAFFCTSCDSALMLLYYLSLVYYLKRKVIKAAQLCSRTLHSYPYIRGAETMRSWSCTASKLCQIHRPSLLYSKSENHQHVSKLKIKSSFSVQENSSTILWSLYQIYTPYADLEQRYWFCEPKCINITDLSLC